mmetsp:Transcript_23239/g.32498  ORF Transcript_23239/g.32498 Transcript_23239/m.32498 type:complete len:98 (-) Transcript_23239:288-581(-)
MPAISMHAYKDSIDCGQSMIDFRANACNVLILSWPEWLNGGLRQRKWRDVSESTSRSNSVRFFHLIRSGHDLQYLLRDARLSLSAVLPCDQFVELLS